MSLSLIPTLLRLLILLCWVLAEAIMAQTPVVHHYTVRAEPDLKELYVTACFASPSPQYLRAYDKQARRILRRMTVLGKKGETRSIKPRGLRIPLGKRVPNSCIDYVVGVRDAVTRSLRRSGFRAGRDIMLSPNLWLWLPEGGYSGAEIEITFELPAGTSVSVPWRLVKRTPNRVVYRLGLRPYSWESRVAFGGFDVREIPAGGATIQLAILDGTSSPDAEALVRWVKEGVRAVTTLYGRFPVPTLQVLVVPIGHGREPVPWGQVMRGGGDAVHLYIDQTRSIEEFLEDWTLVHELSHLLHPRLHWQDAWLSEGIASYYQNVLRARAGTLTPREAWEKLHAGFQRGIRGTPRDLTLVQATENMMRDRLFMRVYWSGAAVALLADFELRRQSGGHQSLDRALARLQACCLPSDRWWRGRELMERLDRLTRTDTFTTLYERYAHSREFPDLNEVYQSLGIDSASRKLKFRDHAPMAEARRAIMSASQVNEN